MRLSTKSSTSSAISAIHVLRQKSGMDDDTYRDFLEAQAGVRSSTELNMAQAARVIERLRELAGEPVTKGAVAGLDTPVGGKLRALWIAGYNCAVVRDRSDRAMLKFLERQTGVSHTRFLAQARDGHSAIEGLKAWLGRAAKIEWPADSNDIIGAKRAVCDAQWRRLMEIGAVKAIGTAADPMQSLLFYAGKVTRQNRWETFTPEDYDQVQAALGRKLRTAIAARAEAST